MKAMNGRYLANELDGTTPDKPGARRDQQSESGSAASRDSTGEAVECGVRTGEGWGGTLELG